MHRWGELAVFEFPTRGGQVTDDSILVRLLASYPALSSLPQDKLGAELCAT